MMRCSIRREMDAMRKIAKLFSLEMRALFSNVVTVIITIGLALMPSLFTWYNVLSCWDVFDNTGDLSVAVASDDEGFSSDLFPLKVNVGEQVISALRANDQINWVFTTSDDAIDGTKSGRYYAAVVIPEGFSRAMLTFYQDDATSAPLVYYTNEKKNAIAPKITSQGADTVSYQVNEVFAETLADISLSIAQSVSQYMDNADVQSRIAVCPVGRFIACGARWHVRSGIASVFIRPRRAGNRQWGPNRRSRYSLGAEFRFG